MYRQFRFDGGQDTLQHVVPARDYVRHKKIGDSATPFKPLPLWRRSLLSLYGLALRALERALGTPLYVQNEFRELILFDPRTRNLLTQLLKKDIVSAWRTVPNIPELPPCYAISLTSSALQLPGGCLVSMQGSVGSGVGNSYTDALEKALAELLERHSLVRWDEHKLVYAAYAELSAQRVVHPNTFALFPETSDRDAVHDTTTLHWVRAHTFTTRAPVYIPASLVFMFFDVEYPEEPVLWESTSNAAAAGQTYQAAQYGAICEAIERDAFLLFWLNGIAPPRIALDSIHIPEVRERVQQLRERGVTCEILDCTTELEIPVFACVAIDPAHTQKVHVHAAAGFDIDTILRKVCEDTVRFLHTDDVTQGESGMDEADIRNITDRERYWSQPGIEEHTLAFLTGEVQELGRKRYATAQPTAAGRIDTLREIFHAHHIRCYTVDITSREAARAGLSVVKAVSPDLVPVYFNEAFPHTNVPRIYNALGELGYRNTPKTENELNTVPHPFI